MIKSKYYCNKSKYINFFYLYIIIRSYSNSIERKKKKGRRIERIKGTEIKSFFF